MVNIAITSESYGVYLKGSCHPSYSLIAVWSVILELLTAICSITVSFHYMQSSAVLIQSLAQTGTMLLVLLLSACT